MSKTIKQIADELGVSKQAVHQKRKSKELSTALQSFTSIVDGVVYITVDGEKLIKQAFLKSDRKRVDDNLSSTKTQTSNHEVSDLVSVLQSTIDTLQGQLLIKDKQIEDLSEALKSAQQTAAAAQALHAGTMQQQLLEDGEKKKSWFKNFLHKERKN